MSTAFIIVTDRCNLNCDFCFYNVGLGERHQIDFDMNNIDLIVTLLEKMNCTKVVLSGGEPLLHKDLFEIVNRFSQIGVDVSISTNGILMTEEKLQTLLKVGLKGLSFSYNTIYKRDNLIGNEQSKIQTFCRIANSYGIKTNVIVTLTKKNYVHASRMFDDLHTNFQPNNIVFTPVSLSIEEKMYLGLDSLTLQDKLVLVESLKSWSSKYKYIGYLDLMSAYLINPNFYGKDCCTKRDAIVIFPDGNIHPCFAISTPTIGHVSNPRIYEMINDFKNAFLYDCFTYNCVCQAQAKDQ